MKLNKVLLFGGSLNPIHTGHINACLEASNFLGIKNIWLIPRKYNYNGTLLLDSKYRLDMINIMIKGHSNISVCDVELKDENKELIYSYNTAKLLTKMYPNNDFYFLIGADQLNSFDKWYMVDELCKLFKFVCYKRPGYIVDEELAKKYNVIIIDGPQIDVSSTIIRGGDFSHENNEVNNYIIKNRLYLENRIKNKLNDRRYNHVLSTANLSKEIAKGNGIDSNKAYVAGLMHDIAKSLDEETTLKMMKEHYPDKLKLGKFCYHAFLSSYISKNEYNIVDEDILKAIENHCLPNKNMSKLDMIIYSADKLELTRPFSSSLDDIRIISYYDIEKAFILVLKDQINYFIRENKDYDKSVLDLISYYEEKLNER